MKLSNEITDYLTGEKFDAGLSIPIAHAENDIISRFSFLINTCQGKNVVHLGCCDHVPLINEKIKNGVWLHRLLMDTCSRVMGVDINDKGIQFLKEELNIPSVYCSNILTDDLPETLPDLSWDYLVMGEILEHIDNPVEFMSQIRKRHLGKIKQVIITVPNAFAIANYNGVLEQKEIINTDHRYWFTPFTLSKILTIAGYKIDSFYYAQEVSAKIGWRAKLKIFPYIQRKMNYQRLVKYPAFRDTLVMIATF